jgi:hypothetical protein
MSRCADECAPKAEHFSISPAFKLDKARSREFKPTEAAKRRSPGKPWVGSGASAGSSYAFVAFRKYPGTFFVANRSDLKTIYCDIFALRPRPPLIP